MLQQCSDFGSHGTVRIIVAQPQVSHAGPSAGRAPRGGTEMIPLRCQVKSGQVRSSQVNKIKQVHEIAKVATFALSREKLYLSNLWIDSQVMHANKQMRAFLPTKTESPWFWSWSPIIYVEVSQQLLVQSTQDFGGQMLQQLPEILLLRFIIRPIELDGHFCKCGLSCVLFF